MKSNCLKLLPKKLLIEIFSDAHEINKVGAADLVLRLKFYPFHEDLFAGETQFAFKDARSFFL